MACADPFFQLDDQSFALQLQLQEIEAQRERQSGKWREDSPPDFALAFSDFEAELKRAIDLVEDVKLAHSIARAVDSDAFVIEESRAEEAQAIQDREFARSLNEDENIPSLNHGAADFQDMSRFGEESVEWDGVLRATEASTFSVDTTVAGPSTDYTFRQRAVFEHLPQLKVECSVCRDSVHAHLTVRLACKDIWCKPCLEEHILRVARDQTMFPPKCHKRLIEDSTIEASLSAENLKFYRSAELEFTCTNRVYCANPECAKFVPVHNRTIDVASCEVCGAETCVNCKELAHEGECSPDEAKDRLLKTADEQGWKTCFGCGEIVFRYEGCDHMTCRCKAEFCYRCGVKWKECLCGDWEPELNHRRAEAIVDREAEWPLEPAIRQQRVVAMRQELLATHECNHGGKFTKLGGSRHGHVCEICDARHYKYILSCRRCHLLACEECRRYRI